MAIASFFKETRVYNRKSLLSRGTKNFITYKVLSDLNGT